MLPRLQRLGPSERRALLSQRSDFAEKHHNLALGSQESTITELQMVGGLCESKVRCIDTIPNTPRCMEADNKCTGPEKASRAREKAACWHNPNNPTRRVAKCNRTE